MKSNTLGMSLLLLVMIGAGSAAPALDVPLTYVQYTDDWEGFRVYGGTPVDVSGKAPTGEWKLPELKGKLPLYALLQLGAREHLLILDRTNENDSFYTRLHLDANANRDLTDDSPIALDSPAETYENQGGASFGPLDANVSYKGQPEGTTSPVHMSFSVNTWNYNELMALSPDSGEFRNLIHVYLSVQCAYQGTLVSESGAKYSIALGDSNGNGTFGDMISTGNEPMKRELSPDVFFITAGELREYGDSLMMGRQLLLEGRLYDVNVDIPQKRLTLTPTTKPLVPAKLAAEAEHVLLRALEPADTQSIMMFRPGKNPKIPEGKYCPYGYQLIQKDAKGDTWRLRAVPMGNPAAVSVTAAGGTIEFGEPYTPVISVDPNSLAAMKRGETTGVHLVFQLEGQSKERVVDLRHTEGTKTDIALSQKSSDRPQEPAYRVVTDDGEVVAQGSFEWG